MKKIKTTPVSLMELKDYFNTHYGWITMELSDNELSDWMAQSYIINLPIERMADCLSDYLLSNGADAQE